MSRNIQFLIMLSGLLFLWWQSMAAARTPGPNLTDVFCVMAILGLIYYFKLKEQSFLWQEKNRRDLERAYLEISERSAQLQRLVDMMKAPVSELDMENILQRFVALAGSVGEFTGHALYFSPEPTNAHWPLASQEASGSEMTWPPFLPKGKLDEFISPLSYMTSLDVSAKAFEEKFLSSEVDREWVALPLRSRKGDLTGVLILFRIPRGGFAAKEIEALIHLTAQATLIIENAWLFLKANEASRAKSEFLANMSHEIRTPLNALLGFSEILTQPAASEALKTTAVQNIKKNGQTLTRLIDDLLDLAKMESGKFSLSFRETSLTNLLNDVDFLMRPQAEKKNLDFRTVLQGQIPEKILIDDVRLRQILLNLVSNAIKFTDQGFVEISVEARPREVGPRLDLKFRVRDSGVGIKDDLRGRLFKSFTQGDSSHSRIYGGAGLGLVLAKKLSQELGGDIELLPAGESAGSIFEVQLTVDPIGAQWVFSDVPKGNPALPLIPGHKKARILLVEDSEDNQEIFEYFLKSAGHDVVTVNNGLDAVKKAQGSALDLILMDIQLPGLDGKQATYQIRHQGFDQPIVALTAHALPEEIEACLKAGCDGQITKPVTGQDLLKAVDAYINDAKNRGNIPQASGRDSAL